MTCSSSFEAGACALDPRISTSTGTGAKPPAGIGAKSPAKRPRQASPGTSPTSQMPDTYGVLLASGIADECESPTGAGADGAIFDWLDDAMNAPDIFPDGDAPPVSVDLGDLEQIVGTLWGDCVSACKSDDGVLPGNHGALSSRWAHRVSLGESWRCNVEKAAMYYCEELTVAAGGGVIGDGDAKAARALILVDLLDGAHPGFVRLTWGLRPQGVNWFRPYDPASYSSRYHASLAVWFKFCELLYSWGDVWPPRFGRPPAFLPPALWPQVVIDVRYVLFCCLPLRLLPPRPVLRCTTVFRFCFPHPRLSCLHSSLDAGRNFFVSQACISKFGLPSQIMHFIGKASREELVALERKDRCLLLAKLQKFAIDPAPNGYGVPRSRVCPRPPSLSLTHSLIHSLSLSLSHSLSLSLSLSLARSLAHSLSLSLSPSL